MLNYRLINTKPLITVNNRTYQDLLSKTINDERGWNANVVIVNKYYVARPDLISLAMYGDDKYADIICKINGISNPFELNEDDVLLIPNINYLNDCLNKQRVPSEIISDPKQNFIQPIDVNNKQKKKDELRSPNEQTIGESNYIIDKSLGIVFY
jgi:hypothetical protein